MTNEVRLLWTWCHSHVCTSSWRASHPWHLVARSNIVHWPSQNLVQIGPHAWRPWSRTYLPKVKISTLLVVAVDSVTPKLSQVPKKSTRGKVSKFELKVKWADHGWHYSKSRFSGQVGPIPMLTKWWAKSDEVNNVAMWPKWMERPCGLLWQPSATRYSVLPCQFISRLFYPEYLSPSSSPPLQLAVSATSVPPIPTQSALFTHPFIRLRNWRNKCSMPKTWCAQQIPVMDVTWQPRRCSGAACQRKRCQGSKSQTAVCVCVFFFWRGWRAGKIRVHEIFSNMSGVKTVSSCATG